MKSRLTWKRLARLLTLVIVMPSALASCKCDPSMEDELEGTVTTRDARGGIEYDLAIHPASSPDSPNGASDPDGQPAEADASARSGGGGGSPLLADLYSDAHSGGRIRSDDQDIENASPSAEVVEPENPAQETAADAIVENAAPAEPMPLPAEEEIIEGIIEVAPVKEAALPEGWAEPVDIPIDDPARRLIGVWRQSDGSTTADFAMGGYTGSTIIFTGYRRLHVVRRVGDALSEVSVFSYRINAAGKLELSAIDERQAAGTIARPLDVTIANGRTMTVTPRRLPLPVALDYSIKGESLRLHGKQYKRTQ